MKSQRVIQLLGLFLLLLTASAKAESFCDPSLPNDSESPMGYHMRGDRCEGIYDQQVSAVSVEIRSLVASFGPFDPARIEELDLAWTAPPGSTRDVELRAFSFKPRTYYRMDTKVPAARKIYRWPTDVLASVDLNRDDLGLVAWTRLPGSRTVYLPLRAGQGTRAKDGYEVTLMPTKNLSEVRVTIARLDDQGKEVTKLRQNKELGYGYYPSDQPTIFTTGKLGPAGFYRISITATPKSGTSVQQDIEIYHAGD